MYDRAPIEHTVTCNHDLQKAKLKTWSGQDDAIMEGPDRGWIFGMHTLHFLCFSSLYSYRPY